MVVLKVMLTMEAGALLLEVLGDHGGDLQGGVTFSTTIQSPYNHHTVY